MKLVDYIREERGNATALAAALSVSLSYLSQMASTGVVSPLRAVAIERATNLKVRRWDLRPHEWHLIWPELIGVDGAPSVPTASEGQERAAA